MGVISRLIWGFVVLAILAISLASSSACEKGRTSNFMVLAGAPAGEGEDVSGTVSISTRASNWACWGCRDLPGLVSGSAPEVWGRK